MSDSDLVRLNYASTATFEPNYQGGIEVEVAQILSKSRRNNARVKVGGVLHYGKGYFFQCLEGPRDAVNETYNRIGGDTRHKDVQLLSFERISHRLFTDWSMKYLPVDGPIKALLAKRDLSFNPYRFDDNLLKDILDVCARGIDPTELPDREGKGPARDAPWWKKLLGKA